MSTTAHGFSRALGRRLSLGFALGMCLMAAAASVDAQGRPAAVSSPSAKPLEDGLKALSASEYEKAERLLTEASRGGARSADAWLGLSRLRLVTGKYAEAVTAAETAARSRPLKLQAVVVKAQALSAQGKLEQAIDTLRAVESEPQGRRARLLLGELLIAMGKSAEARAPLMTLVQEYNDDKIASQDADGLAMVGRAAHLLRSARDANDAYNEAERAGKPSVETLLWRAELFLEKYDAGHAEEVVKEALEIAPEHPDARVLMARVKLDQALDFGAAERLIERALRVNPNHTGAYFVRAGLGLRDYDLEGAKRAADRGLQVNPRDLPLLSIRAATLFLADDHAGFEAARKKVLEVNPEFSSMYQIIGEFADWEHRYPEIVAMMREAVGVDPKDGKAWAVLGLNLIRLGEDDEGVDALRKGWRYDKFNVRAYNTLNLFERDIPAQYETVEIGSFKYRFDKKERAVLERYIPPMLQEAYDSMVKHYGFTPSHPVGIELYSNREHFSVRTSGLPNIGIQGVCFGTTLAASSPQGDAFNWGNVLWHELAHVFAIQLSKAHVPRWFTEGLSEYETFLRHPDWQREEDVALYTALENGRLPKVANFNRAFTHVDDMSDVTMAYYAASQIVVYLGQEHGMPKLVEMLRLWGQGHRDPEVVRRALGMSMDELDQRFRAWLEPRMARYRKQFVADLRAPEFEQAEEAAKANPSDVRKQVELILAAAGEGDAEKAMAALEAAQKLQRNDPHVRYLTARMMLKNKRIAPAQQELEAMVREGHDGYEVRMRLADIAEAQKDTKAMRGHMYAARRLDPSQVEPLQALHDLAKKEGRNAEVTSTLRELSVLDQHERRAYTRLMQQLADAELWQELKSVGERAIFVDVNGYKVHQLYGDALLREGERQKGLFELESALLCEPEKEDAVKIHVLMAKAHKQAGASDKAKASAQQALELDPQNAEARALAK